MPLYQREPSVQNLLRDALTRASPFKTVMVVGEDEEGNLVAGWSDMGMGDMVLLAEYAKSKAIRGFYK